MLAPRLEERRQRFAKLLFCTEVRGNTAQVAWLTASMLQTSALVVMGGIFGSQQASLECKD